MNERNNNEWPLFSFDFNRSVKVHAESSNITSNAGVLPLHEDDHPLAITETIAGDILDSHNQEHIRYGLGELLRERLYAIATGYAQQEDADILAHNPAFKIAVRNKAGTQVADERIVS